MAKRLPPTFPTSMAFRVESWEGQIAKFYVNEDYAMKIGNGDTVALRLMTKDGRNSSVTGFESWWSLVRDVTPGIAPDVIAASETAPPTPGESPKAPGPTVEQQNLKVSDRMVDLLRSFIQAHHAKSSRGDVDGLVADYAD